MDGSIAKDHKEKSGMRFLVASWTREFTEEDLSLLEKLLSINIFEKMMRRYFEPGIYSITVQILVFTMFTIPEHSRPKNFYPYK